MLTLLPLVIALAGDPSPAPQPSSAPPPTPLKEIGRTRALPVCTTIVVHANGAITNALNNDQDLAIVINHLRTTDLDGANVMQHRERINDLVALAKKIRESSSAGDAEVKRLRDLAVASKDPQRKADLKAFADALGGALLRQKRAAVDLDKAITIMEGRRATAVLRSPEDSQPQALTPRGMSPQRPDNPLDQSNYGPNGASRNVASQNAVLKTVANDLEARATPILIDEGVAADHSLGATTGC
ncbi:MAG: hypothetical protein ABR591_10345 [Candidatus Velthaea sp.]